MWLKPFRAVGFYAMNGTFQSFFFYLFLFLIALTSYSAELKFADVQNKHANRKHTATKPNETNANKENTSKKQSFAYIQASLKIFKHHGWFAVTLLFLSALRCRRGGKKKLLRNDTVGKKYDKDKKSTELMACYIYAIYNPEVPLKTQ